MDIKKISDSEQIMSFDLICPFCSKNYKVNKIYNITEHFIKPVEYTFPNEDDHCKHLLLWQSNNNGRVYSDSLISISFGIAASSMPFSVEEVVQEIINNGDIPKTCEVRIKAFYVDGFIVFIFTNNPNTITNLAIEKSKSYRKYFSSMINKLTK